MQQKTQKQTSAHSRLHEQTGDLTKTLSQVHTCVEHAINQCRSVLAVPPESEQTVQQLRSQVSKVVASLKPAADRAAMRLETERERQRQRQRDRDGTSLAGSQRSPPQSRYGSPRRELSQPPPLVRRLVVTGPQSPETAGPFTSTHSVQRH